MIKYSYKPIINIILEVEILEAFSWKLGPDSSTSVITFVYNFSESQSQHNRKWGITNPNGEPKASFVSVDKTYHPQIPKGISGKYRF